MKTLHDLPLDEKLIDDSGEVLLDSSLICAAEKVEHYEIEIAGWLYSWARHMAYEEIVQFLGQSLEEGKGAEFKLTQLAESLSLEHPRKGSSQSTMSADLIQAASHSSIRGFEECRL